MGADGRCASARSIKSAGPPRAVTIRPNTSAACPVARASATRTFAAAISSARPPITSSSAVSASVTAQSRGSGVLPVRMATDSATSTALPAVRPSTWFISVINARVAIPAPLPTATKLCAKARAVSGVSANAPLPNFTSRIRDCTPAASFLDRIEAVIRSMLSTVPVTSRIAYSRRSAGAMSPVAPTMAHPTSLTTRVIVGKSGWLT